MTTASQTNYRLSGNSFFKDAGGAKGIMWPREDASVTPLTLPKGIATSQNNASLLFSHLAIATHTQASPVEAYHPGVLFGGVYLDNPLSASRTTVGSGQFRLGGALNTGEVLATPVPMNASLMTGSKNTFSVTDGSLILMGVCVAYEGASSGDVVRVKDGNDLATKWVNYFDMDVGSIDHKSATEMFGGGIRFNSPSAIVTISVLGTASAIVYYK